MVLHWMMQVTFLITQILKNADDMAASAHLEGFVLADQLDLVIADPPELQLRVSEMDFVIA